MIKNNENTRFGRRLESLFWWIVRLFPFIVYLVYFPSILRSNPIVESLMNTGQSDVLFEFCSFERCMYWLGIPDYGFFNQLLVPIFDATFGLVPFLDINTGFYQYFGYLAFVEFARIFLEILIILPKLARNLFERLSL